MNDNEFNINSLLTKKLFFEMNSERTKKRMAQMQRIKNTINENDSPKEDKSTFNSTQSPTNEDYNLNHQSNRKNQNNNKNSKIENYNNVFNNNVDNNNIDNLINPFINNDEINENKEDVEINISDLDCNIDDLNEYENSYNKNLIKNSKNDYGKTFYSLNSKSFIHLNNNLIAKAATKNDKNTNSYLMALCPELIINKNKEKNVDNYYVDDVIKEENEIEIPLKYENNTIENNIKNDLLIDEYNQNKIFHQKAKSGNDFKEILKNSTKILGKKKKKKNIKFNIKKAKNFINVKRNNISDFSKTFCSPIHRINKLSKINLSIQKENRSNSKNKKNKKFINVHHQYFSNKIPKIKMKIAIMSNNNSRSNSLNHHIKNKTTFTSPSYVNKIEYNTIYNYSKNNNKLYNKNYKFNKNKLVNKTNYRLFEIKKAIKTLENNQRKNNNFGLFFPNSNKKNNNSNSIILQKSFANFEISNRNKVINAMQKINFLPLSFYSKSLNELNKCKGNLFCILVSNEKIKNKNKQFLFKGLYEINQNEGNVNGKSVFCISNAPKIIKINDYENFLNYDLNKGNFEKYKFLLKGNKKFNCSTIIVY